MPGSWARSQIDLMPGSQKFSRNFRRKVLSNFLRISNVWFFSRQILRASAFYNIARLSPVSLQLQTYQDISHFNLNAKVSSTAFSLLCCEVITNKSMRI